MRKFLFKPYTLLLIYIAIIAIFSFIYIAFGDGKFEGNESISLAEGIYFSVVTITTLGYGDITPLTETFMLITAFEAFIGIVIIGVFLNSLWRTYSVKIEKDQREKLESKNRENISYYYRYLESIINNYEDISIEITTKYENRVKDKIEKKFNPNFEFSGLKDMFRYTTNMKYGFHVPTIVVFFQLEEEIRNELKYFLSSFDLSNHQKIRNIIVSYLIIFHKYETKPQILSYLNTTIDEELMSNYISRKVGECESFPDQNKMLSSVNYFARALITKMEFIDSLKGEFNKIS